MDRTSRSSARTSSPRSSRSQAYQAQLRQLLVPRNRFVQTPEGMDRPATSQQMMLLREQIAAQAADNEAKATAITEAEEETEAAQPETYMAYGETAFCRAHCAAAPCTGCCTGVRLGMEAQIGAIAFACHTLSDLCPWCHAGCAANTAMMHALAMTQFAGCTTSCSRPVELLVSQGNPRNCPIN